MKKYLILVLFIGLMLLQVVPAEARSGCCSHHGGVCGCGCCDGSGLSAKCAPYYPECNGGSGESSTSTSEQDTLTVPEVPVYIPPTNVPPTRIPPTAYPTWTPIPTATKMPRKIIRTLKKGKVVKKKKVIKLPTPVVTKVAKPSQK